MDADRLRRGCDAAVASARAIASADGAARSPSGASSSAGASDSRKAHLLRSRRSAEADEFRVQRVDRLARADRVAEVDAAAVGQRLDLDGLAAAQNDRLQRQLVDERLERVRRPQPAVGGRRRVTAARRRRRSTAIGRPSRSAPKRAITFVLPGLDPIPSTAVSPAPLEPVGWSSSCRLVTQYRPPRSR